MPATPDDGLDTAAAFAADLRTLRHEAGNPTLGQIERESGVSKSVVSDAFAGRKLPSARTVRGVVAACGGDVAAWVARRDAIAAAPAPDPSPAAAAAPSPEASRGAQEPAPAAASPRLVRLSTLLVAVAAALVVGVGGTLAVVAGTSPGRAAAATSPTPGRTAGAPAIAVRVGADPADTACLKGAVIAASETGARGTVLQIVYSNRCHAAWSRITRNDGDSNGNTVSTSIYRKSAPHASDRQSTTEPDAQSAYTTLLVRPTPQTEICATGSITVSGATIDVGKIVCV